MGKRARALWTFLVRVRCKRRIRAGGQVGHGVGLGSSRNGWVRDVKPKFSRGADTAFGVLTAGVQLDDLGVDGCCARRGKVASGRLCRGSSDVRARSTAACRLRLLASAPIDPRGSRADNLDERPETGGLHGRECERQPAAERDLDDGPLLGDDARDVCEAEGVEHAAAVEDKVKVRVGKGHPGRADDLLFHVLDGLAGLEADHLGRGAEVGWAQLHLDGVVGVDLGHVVHSLKARHLHL